MVSKLVGNGYVKYLNLYYFRSINIERKINFVKKLENLLPVTYREMISIAWKSKYTHSYLSQFIFQSSIINYMTLHSL